MEESCIDWLDHVSADLGNGWSRHTLRFSMGISLDSQAPDMGGFRNPPVGSRDIANSRPGVDGWDRRQRGLGRWDEFGVARWRTADSFYVCSSRKGNAPNNLARRGIWTAMYDPAASAILMSFNWSMYLIVYFQLFLHDFIFFQF